VGPTCRFLCRRAPRPDWTARVASPSDRLAAFIGVGRPFLAVRTNTVLDSSGPNATAVVSRPWPEAVCAAAAVQAPLPSFGPPTPELVATVVAAKAAKPEPSRAGARSSSSLSSVSRCAYVRSLHHCRPSSGESCAAAVVVFSADHLTPLSPRVQVTGAGKLAAARSQNHRAIYTVVSAGERLSCAAHHHRPCRPSPEFTAAS
jgi:hypothetical protein